MQEQLHLELHRRLWRMTLLIISFILSLSSRKWIWAWRLSLIHSLSSINKERGELSKFVFVWWCLFNRQKGGESVMPLETPDSHTLERKHSNLHTLKYGERERMLGLKCFMIHSLCFWWWSPSFVKGKRGNVIWMMERKEEERSWKNWLTTCDLPSRFEWFPLPEKGWRFHPFHPFHPFLSL